MTYNSRRGFLGAIPVVGEIAYHLYNISTSKAGNTVKLIRKSRWHSQHDSKWVFKTDSFEYSQLDDCITSLDFNPQGEIAATIDHFGTCLISDVDTNSYRFHMKIMRIGKGGGKRLFRIQLIFRPLYSTKTRLILFFFL